MNKSKLCALLLAYSAVSPSVMAANISQSDVSLNTSLSAEVTQDVAVVKLFSEFSNNSSKSAYALASASAGKAQDLAKSKGFIVKQTVVTTHPIYSKDNKIDKWVSRVSFNVETSDLKGVQEYIVSLGDTAKVEYVSYKVSDALKDKVEAELSAKAITALDSRVHSIVKDNTLTIDLKEFNVTYSGGMYSPPAPRMAMMKGALLESAPQMTLDPGTESVSISVSAKYFVRK